MSLTLYKPLTSNDLDTRIQAAKQLTSELGELLDGERTDESKKIIDYALKRLTRGLSSGSESARPGFAVVLTEFLTTLLSAGDNTKWDISITSAIEAVKTNTTPQGHSNGQEGRDYALGRLFGLQALIQSNILFSNPSNVTEYYAPVIDLLFELADARPWLRESCAWTLAGSVSTWPAATAKEAAGVTFEKLKASGFAKSGEGVGVWLALQAEFTDVKRPKDVWAKESPLEKGNLIKLAKVLKESYSKEDGDENAKAKGSWNPKLSFTWDSILDVYFGEGTKLAKLREEKGAVAEWEEFWRVVVDESLFSSSSSEERKYWGFLFLLRTLDRLPATPTATSTAALETIFSKNLLRSLTNHLSDSERYLYKIARKVTNSLIAKSESAPWTVPTIFACLTATRGTTAYNFDQMTKSKTLEKIIVNADENGSDALLIVLKSMIEKPFEKGDATDDEAADKKFAEGKRQWAADLILNMVRSGKGHKSEAWMKNVIELLTEMGYFLRLKADKKQEASEVSRTMFRARLISALTQLLGVNGGKTDETAESWPWIAVNHIKSLLENKKYKLIVEADGEIEAALEDAVKAVSKIRKKRAAAGKGSNVDNQLLAFEMLYSLIILQVYNGEPDALSVLEDLKSIQKDMLAASAPKPKKEKKRSKKSKHAHSDSESDEEEEVDPSEVLLDILLSFLSRPSNLLKRIAHTVFAAFAPSITPAALERCFDVLRTKEGLEGQQQLFDQQDDDEDLEAADANSDNDEEHDSDVEMLDGEEILDSDVEVSDASDDDDEDDDMEADADTLALEAALRSALDAPKGDDEDSDADEDMPLDESAMEALDATLSNIFKQRKQVQSKKKDAKDAKELVVTFKSKVLELLELLVKSRPLSPPAWVVIIPAFQAVEETRDAKVADRAVGVVKAWVGAVRKTLADAEESEDLDLDEDELVQLLNTLHQLATTAPKKAAPTISSASVTICKLLVRKDEANLELAVGMYAESLKDWARSGKGESMVGNAFFADFVGWCGSLRREVEREEKVEKKKGKKGKKAVEVEVREEVEEKSKGKKGKKREREEEVVEEKVEKKMGGGNKKRRKAKGGKKD